MIRKTLSATKSATFSVYLHDDAHKGFPRPMGTGFFISPDGWFITAAHVLAHPNGQLRPHANKALLSKEDDLQRGPVQLDGLSISWINTEVDVALLKVEFSSNSHQPIVAHRTDFPSITVSSRPLEEGEPVYSFGYPLPKASLLDDVPRGLGSDIQAAAIVELKPRTTSAIVSAIRHAVMPSGALVPFEYDFDKAFNYGNSGGPIVASETGDVHAVCCRFDPVLIPQSEDVAVMIPSLYSVGVSLSHPLVMAQIQMRDIPTVDRGKKGTPPNRRRKGK